MGGQVVFGVQPDSDGWWAVVYRQGRPYGRKGPYGTSDEASLEADKLAGDAWGRVGDSGDGAQGLLRTAPQ